MAHWSSLPLSKKFQNRFFLEIELQSHLLSKTINDNKKILNFYAIFVMIIRMMRYKIVKVSTVNGKL